VAPREALRRYQKCTSADAKVYVGGRNCVCHLAEVLMYILDKTRC